MIGFEPMFMNIILLTWSYSCYLTLNELSVVLYVFFILLATINGVYWIDKNDTYQYPLEDTQILGFMCNMAMHCVNMYQVGKAYYVFRKTGGIKGLNPT